MNSKISLGIIIYLLAIIVPLIQNKSFKAKYISLFLSLTIFDAFINLGYIAQIGTFTLEYNILTSILLLIPSIYVILTNKMNRQLNKCFAIFVICILISTSKSLIINPQVVGLSYQESWDEYFAEKLFLNNIKFDSSQFVGMFGRFIITFINYSAFASIFNQHHIKILTKTIRTYLAFNLVLYLVEFYMYNINGNISFREEIVNILGLTNDVYLIPRLFMNKFYSPLMLLKEPSAVALTFFISGCNEIFIYNYKKKKSSLILFFILSILMMITGAMTAILYLVALLITFLSTLFKKKSHLILCFVIFCLLLILPFSILYKKDLTLFLDNFKLYKYGIPYLPASSKIVRTYSIYISILQFIKYPLWGIGLGASYSHSGFFTMLSNIGLLGCATYFILISKYYSNFKFRKSSYALSIFSLIICYSISGHFSMFLYIQYTLIIFFLLTASNKCEKNNLYLTEKEKNFVLSNYLASFIN